MSKFKVGDRVAVYGYDSLGIRNIRGLHLVVDTGGEGFLKVRHASDLGSDEHDALVHEKQCRRLKSKTKQEPEPLVAWVAVDGRNTMGDLTWSKEEAQKQVEHWDNYWAHEGPNRLVKLVEVKE